MSEKTNGSGDYEVGYGKPPKHGQFEPGQSGNPRGRPKGRASFPALLERCLDKRTRVKVGGDIKNMSVLEAIAMRLVQEMINGPTDKAITILKYIKPMLEVEASASIPLEVIEEALTAEELFDLAHLQEKIEKAMENRGLNS